MSNETNLYEIPHYKMYANCNDKYRAGGIVIYVKLNIKIHDCCILKINTADALKLEFEFEKHAFSVLAFYRLHLFTKELFVNELSDYLNSERNLRNIKNVIFIGDININILENKSVVDDYCNELALSGLECLSREATRITVDSESCLDHVFAKVTSKDQMRCMWM